MPATSSDALDIMLAHDHWATRELLELCRGLSRDEFHRKFQIGLGSLHENTTHIISAIRRWCDRLMGRPPRPSLHKIGDRPDIPHEAADRTPDELLELLDSAHAELMTVVKHCRDLGLGTTISMDWPAPKGGNPKAPRANPEPAGGPTGMLRYTFTRAAVLCHVTTHGHYHRAQCINMLRHLNHPGLSDRLPDLSVVDWQAHAESPAMPV
ncbi:MAG TPA: DinB family protein [Phycisphaerales bacterium]|nr:DinB family protein [Phycisphaerales bacterium]